MPMDFTVIQSVRQRFGEKSFGRRRPQFPLESAAPFVGKAKNYPFSCPNVDRKERAVLQFESIGVEAEKFRTVPLPGRRNILQINRIDIPGGITPGSEDYEQDDQQFWRTHSLVVGANVLKERNVLRIEAVVLGFGHGVFGIDNFMIDNIVLFYKTLN